MSKYVVKIKVDGEKYREKIHDFELSKRGYVKGDRSTVPSSLINLEPYKVEEKDLRILFGDKFPKDYSEMMYRKTTTKENKYLFKRLGQKGGSRLHGQESYSNVVFNFLFDQRTTKIDDFCKEMNSMGYVASIEEVEDGYTFNVSGFDVSIDGGIEGSEE